MESEFPLDRPLDAGHTIPESWKREVQAQLEAGETVAAWFEPDLDQRLLFARRLVVLTNRGLRGFCESETPGQENANGDGAAAPRWQHWALDDSLKLRSQERG